MPNYHSKMYCIATNIQNYTRLGRKYDADLKVIVVYCQFIIYYLFIMASD